MHHIQTKCRAEASVASDVADLMSLGRTALQVSRIGVGTLQWGDPGSGYGEKYDETGLAEAFDVLLENGINVFDTAEVYGYQNIKTGQSSEQLVGRFLNRPVVQNAPVKPILATKYFTIPWTKFLVGGGWRLDRTAMVPALKESLKRMGRDQVDLWQIHFPFPTISNQALMDGLKEAMDLGLTKAVGVSNYNKVQMEAAHKILESNGIPLASNQVRYSLLSRGPEEDGLLAACEDLQVTLIAYSPLASGLLTDKSLGRKDREALKVQPLLKLMDSIGAQHGGKSISQVALNYLICKGALPIAGCKSAAHARSHVGVLGWRLDADEVTSLDGKVKALDI